MKSSSSQLYYREGQNKGPSAVAFDCDKSVVFFLFDLTQCKFYYAGGSPIFKGYQSSSLLTTECMSLKEILHPDDFHYLLQIYNKFNDGCRQSGFDRKTHFKWTAEIRILTEVKQWNWVEVSFDILSYTEDNAIDKMFCTLKDKSKSLQSSKPKTKNNSSRRANRRYSGPISRLPFIGNKAPVRKLLGAREIQVLRLIANGNSDKEIAKRLGISIHTSIRHRKNLIEKFKVKNTAELIKDASKVIWL